jgi:hypothetical protein
MRRSGVMIAISMLGLSLSGVASGGAVRQLVAAKVTVTFTDTKLTVVPGGLRSGKATFVVINKGRRAHALAIAGPGLKDVQTPKLATGKSATLNVTVRTGAYMLSDPAGVNVFKVKWLVVTPAAVVSSGPNSARPNGPAGTSSGQGGGQGGGLDGSMACDI